MDNILIRLVEDNLKELGQSNLFPLLNSSYQIGKDFINVEHKTLKGYPKFKNLTDEDIVRLRLFLQQKIEFSQLQTWAVSLVRYIEIQYPLLKKKEKLAGRDSIQSKSLFTQLISFFVEYYVETKDLIYLNTTLKILDLKWIKPVKRNSLPTYVLYRIKVDQIEKILISI